MSTATRPPSGWDRGTPTHPPAGRSNAAVKVEVRPSSSRVGGYARMRAVCPGVLLRHRPRVSRGRGRVAERASLYSNPAWVAPYEENRPEEELTVSVKVPCQECGGLGYIQRVRAGHVVGDKTTKCRTCRGRGLIPDDMPVSQLRELLR